MIEHLTDVAIVGSGPAGLSAAINLASEGLQVTVIEQDKVSGGQAKHSSAVENYLGFPKGLTGKNLMSRSYHQALRFGAKFIYNVSASKLTNEGTFRIVHLSNGEKIISHAVVLANGLEWRKLETPGFQQYENHGVFYGLNMDLFPAIKDKMTAVIGGANSAGQAALWLNNVSKKSYIINRGDNIASMSHYLSDRITKNRIEVLNNAEITSSIGDGDHLTEVTVKTPDNVRTFPMDYVFIFAGSKPRTDWLNGACKVDSEGFVITNNYHSTCEGVFAIGDVRKDSVKRINAAAGEGSSVIPFIHEYLTRILGGK